MVFLLCGNDLYDQAHILECLLFTFHYNSWVFQWNNIQNEGMNLPVGCMKGCLHTGNQMLEVQVVIFHKTIAMQSFGQLTEPEEVSRSQKRQY